MGVKKLPPILPRLEIVIEPPIVLDVLGEDGEPDPDTKVIVNFTAIIPTNIGRKELH